MHRLTQIWSKNWVFMSVETEVIWEKKYFPFDFKNDTHSFDCRYHSFCAHLCTKYLFLVCGIFCTMQKFKVARRSSKRGFGPNTWLSYDGLVLAGRIRLVLAGRIVCTSFHWTFSMRMKCSWLGFALLSVYCCSNGATVPAKVMALSFSRN